MFLYILNSQISAENYEILFLGVTEIDFWKTHPKARNFGTILGFPKDFWNTYPKPIIWDIKNISEIDKDSFPENSSKPYLGPLRLKFWNGSIPVKPTI